jgi:hypothetical protein
MGRRVGAVSCLLLISFVVGFATHSIRGSIGAVLALLALGALLNLRQKRYLYPREWMMWVMNTRDIESFADRIAHTIQEFQAWDSIPSINSDSLLNYCIIQLEEAQTQAESATQGWRSFDALQRTQVMDGLRSKMQIAIQEIDSRSWTESNQYRSWTVRPYYWNSNWNWRLLPVGLFLLICAVFISWPVLAEFGSGLKPPPPPKSGLKPPPPPKVVCKKCKSLNDPFLVGKSRTHCGICGERL